MPRIPDPNLLTPHEAARLVPISDQEIRREGRLRSLAVGKGGHRRIGRQHLRQFA